MIVQKFGGSCLDRPDDLRRMVRIVKSARRQRPVVVLSAFKGVTDQLLAQADQARNAGYDISELEAKHVRLLDDLATSPRAVASPSVRRLLLGLNAALKVVSRRRQLSRAAGDEVAAYGEKLAISVAFGYFAEAGIAGVPLSGAGAGIITDGVFGNATILKKSYPIIRRRLSKVRLPIVAGFFGADGRGRTTTLGRGGSDYVATFIAAALGCRAVLYKDVDGVMTADPRMVPGARLVPKLSYQTAAELGRCGSKVIFEKAIPPAMDAGITIEIRSFSKLNRGTIIGARGTGAAVATTRGYPAGVTHGARPPQDVSTIAVVGSQVTPKQVESKVRGAGLNQAEVFRSPSGISTYVVVNWSEAGRATGVLHTFLGG